MLRHQPGQQADAQPLAHHGQDRPILPGGVFHLGPDAHFVEGGHDLVVLALLQQNKRLRGQLLHREGVRLGQGVVARHHHLQFIPVQGVGLQVLGGR